MADKLAMLAFNFVEMYWLKDAPHQILALLESDVITFGNLALVQ